MIHQCISSHYFKPVTVVKVDIVKCHISILLTIVYIKSTE